MESQSIIQDHADNSGPKIYNQPKGPVLKNGDIVNVHSSPYEVVHATLNYVTVYVGAGVTQTYQLFTGIVDRLIF